MDHLLDLMTDGYEVLTALAAELARRRYVSHQTLIALLEAEKEGLDMTGIPNHVDKEEAY
jgi:hypothetical protein